MPNIVDRTIGNEIRRVQDEVRRSIDDVKEETEQTINKIKEDVSKVYEDGRRFINQLTRNRLTDIAQSSTEGGVDPKELVEDITSQEDLEIIEQTDAKEMDFPALIFFMAVIVDVLDIFVTALPGVMTVVNIVFSIFLYFWFKGKIEESFVEDSQNIARTNRRIRRYSKLANSAMGKQAIREAKKRFAKKFGDRFAKQVLLRKFWRYAVLSLIWIVQIFVLQTLFVIVVWKQQTKMVKAYKSFVAKISDLLDTIDSYEESLTGAVADFAENGDSEVA